jgi:antimicrobial peptide system SdpB family protein
MLTRTESPWTNVYGVARSLLALSTLLTLLADSSERIFQPLTVADPGIIDRSAVLKASLFFLARNHLASAKLMAVLVLVLVIVGWRPRLTALPHWWVSFSFAASASLIEGGDLIASIVTLLLIPVALSDHRVWHWQRTTTGSRAGSVAAQTGLLLIRVQVAVIYLFAAVLKFPAEEWANGTALYYVWLSNTFGPAGLVRLISSWIGTTVLIVPLTWSVLVLELCLAAALVAPLRFRARLLPVALLFHLAIAVCNGLPTFAIAMSAALVLYLRPAWLPFPLPETLRRPARHAAAKPVEHVSFAP